MTVHESHAIDACLREILRPGQDIVVAQAFGFPCDVVAALSRHQDLLRGSRVFFGMTPVEIPQFADVSCETLFPSGPFGTTDAMQARNVVYCRRTLYDLSCAFRDHTKPADVAIATATPARDGRYSLGLSVDFIHPAARQAATVLLEIVDDLPWTGTGSTISAAPSVVAIQSSRNAMTMPRPDAGDRTLAQHILPWIPDGATLELGMGKWSEALLDLLGQSRRRLRLHTGSLGDWLIPFARSGAHEVGTEFTATAAAGSRAFYDAIPQLGVELVPAYVTHHPETLRSLPHFRAINSVLEVDVLGRANSEYGANGRRGGLGGLPDYAAGAAANPQGLSIVALSATAGNSSRIVAQLPEAHVSLNETQIDVIVTEHGSADLRGKDPRERAAAVLKLAAPQFRSALEREARALELL